MSDTQGSSDEQNLGEPIGENETVVGEASAEASDGVDAPADEAPAGQESAAGPAEEAVEAPASDGPEPAPQAEAPTDQPPAAEVDYAALAAELEEFERRSSDPADALSAPGATDVSAPAAEAAAPVAPQTDPWFEPAGANTFSAAEPAVTPSSPVAPAAAPASPQPIFVQAPEPPKRRGNRFASGMIGLLAAVVFAVLFFGALLVERVIAGTDDIVAEIIGISTSWEMWVPVVVFWLGFWLLGAVVNRAGWGSWVVFGLFVGFISYGGYLLGQLFQAPFWMITSAEAQDVVTGGLLSPIAIVAFILGREITIWFGAWSARRGARITRHNAEAQEEYERTIEAGPQLAQ